MNEMLPLHLCVEPVKNRIVDTSKEHRLFPSSEGIVITAAQEALTGSQLHRPGVEALQT